MLSKHQIAVLIPVHNEEKNIIQVINDFRKFGKIFIVDDNSNDKTNHYCKKKKVKIIKNSIKIGYDRSLRKGFQYIINNEMKIKLIVTADGDGQHIARYIKKILKLSRNYGCIIGSRNYFNRYSEYLINFISKILFNIKDPISGMKCYNLNKIKYKKFIFKSKNDYCGMFFYKMFDKKNIFNVDINVKKQNKPSSFGSGLISNISILKSFTISIL